MSDKFGILQEQAETFERVARGLVDRVNATGGIYFDNFDVPHPFADPDWSDLAFLYLDACRLLKEVPIEEEMP